MRKQFLILAILLSKVIFASNVSITTPTLGNKNTTLKTYDIVFDLKWDNSWRNSNNHDAIWIFVKYQVNGGNWLHAILSNETCNYSTGSQGANANIEVATASSGIMFYRTTTGSGTFNSNNVKLVWNYGLNGIADNDIVKIQLIPIEMVYIPTAAFYVGDGLSNGRFHNGGNASQPFLVNGSTISFGNTNGNLWADNTQTALPGGSLGPFPWDAPTGTLQPNYPTGYNGFYSMKYETSMGDYVLFLNTLTNSQAANHFPTSTEMATNGAACNPCRYNITFNGTSYSTTTPSRANNWATWRDATAYLDWAGLRPMTELEMEKINRGTANTIAGEYAWGSSNIFQINTLSGTDGSGSETANPQNANAHYGLTGTGTIKGPIKIGILENHTTRETRGESFYGVMDMSGGVVEMIVSLGNTNGRSFVGNNGDGVLDVSGYSNTSGWILNTTDVAQVPNGGWGFKGGDFWNSELDLRTSVRNVATFAGGRRLFGLGFRGVFTINFTPTCATSALQKTSICESLIIYPNPTKDFVYLSNNSMKYSNFKLINSQGINCLTDVLGSQINVSALAKGVYFIEVSNNETSIKSIQKLIIQ